MYLGKKIFNMVRDHVHMVSVVQGGGEVTVYLALLGAPLFDHSTGKPPKRRALHEIRFLLFPYIFNPPPHFRNFSTNQSIVVLSLLNIFTVFNTHIHTHTRTHARAHTHIHTASQNIDGFVKGDHVVTILFVLTFSEMNINFRFL